MKKIIIPAVAAFVILFGAIFSCAYISSQSSAVCSEKENAVSMEYEISSGMTARAVGRELEKSGIIKNGQIFYVFARFPKLAVFFTHQNAKIFKIQTGYYEVNSAMTLADVFAEVSTGKERTVTVSIPEGLTVSKIAERFEKAGFGSAKDFVTVATTNGKEIFTELKIDLDIDSVEGFLFPDTYKVPVTYDAKKIIIMMIRNLLKQLQANEETKSIVNIPSKEFYEKLILASIVEREYRAEDEAALIAGVFKNRLSINMPLQSCATVEYIITEINHKPHPKIIFFDDLESRSPYNTYKFPGLPPGPISNPGLTAIKAAFNPKDSNYLYFTLTDANAGRHTFSKDFNSHAKATNEFKTKKAAGN